MPRRVTEKQYDLWARFYDLLWGRYSSRTSARLLEHADVRPGERVLDVGCGTGTIEAQLLAKNPLQHVTGVDVSERMLARARERAAGDHIRFRRAAAADLPFEDRSFDVVLSASALHYFPQPVDTLREMRRVLKRSGRIALLDWCRSSAIMTLRDAVLRRIDPAHVRCYTEGDVRSMLDDAGFRKVSVENFRYRSYRMLVATARIDTKEEP